MAGCSDKKNPLVRSATSQQQRMLSALGEHYADVDEKKYADWIVFANEFSAYINYYTPNDSAYVVGKVKKGKSDHKLKSEEDIIVDGNWKPFFSNDISAMLGVAVLQDIAAYRRSLKERFDYLKGRESEVDIDEAKRKLNELFSCIFTLCSAMDEYVLRLPENLSIRNTLRNLIAKLAPAMRQLLAYYKGAASLHFLQVSGVEGWKVFNKPVVDAKSIITGAGLSNLWYTKTNTVVSWKTFVNATVKDTGIFGETIWSDYRRLNHAANHNLFSGIFDQFIAGFTKFIDESEKQLLLTLENWDTHPPHYALFLSFLKLFRIAQQDMNKLTKRHLDYYYKEILRLMPREAVPNQAHILVELAKQVDEYMLKEGTLLKAGKDSEGKEVVYKLQQEQVFNKAKVERLMGVYKGDLSPDGKDNITSATDLVISNNAGRLFAAPVANSADGMGAAFTGTSKEWHPFVNKQYTDGKLTGIDMPYAQIGFAIASHYLFLNEGERKITLRLATNNNGALNPLKFECYLTTAKNWYKIESQLSFNNIKPNSGATTPNLAKGADGATAATGATRATGATGVTGATAATFRDAAAASRVGPAAKSFIADGGVKSEAARMSGTSDATRTAADAGTSFTSAAQVQDKATGTAATSEVATLSAGNEEYAELEFIIPADAPAIVSYDAAKHGGTLNVSLPVLKIMLVNDGKAQYLYESLKDITIKKIEVKVDVGGYTSDAWGQKGVKQLLLSNDFGPLDAAMPFMPFGAQPQKDTTFVIGNKEIFCKKNAQVKLNIEWAKYPANTADIDYDRKYTYTYNSDGKTFTYAPLNNEGDTAPFVKAEYFSGTKWNDTVGSYTIDAIDIFANAKINKKLINNTAYKLPPLFFNAFEDDYTNFNIESRKGFIRLVLQNDFGHKKYLADLTQYLIEKGNSAAQPKLVPQEPIEPYTPIIQSIYLSYTANTVIDLASIDATAFDSREARLFHLYPFGDGEQHKYLSNKEIYLLPQFAQKDNAGNKTSDHTGEFYIGLTNLAGLQSVNILFQLQEGSTDPQLQKPTDHITWSYLSKNEWIDFTNQEIQDATMQLVQSGIITFAIPQGATTDNSILPTGYLWIRAGVTKYAEAVCKLFTVDAQAAALVFEPNGNAPDFLDSTLPAEQIAKLKIPDAAVKKIKQPYSSFGGRANESDTHFYTRISERLRHKGRAITIWDYEHLVLEAYPDIHKVKCLNHTKLEGNIYNEVQPGSVCIITVPNLVNRNDANPLKPYTAQNRLLEIEEFLKKKISSQVSITVRNPQFEEVKIAFKLKLAAGFTDFTFYATKLKEEITQFLTPWAYSSNVDIEFGGKIYKSSLIDFIEERSYVDYITEVNLMHRPGDTAPLVDNLEEVMASTGRSILVSAPASKHEIIPA